MTTDQQLLVLLIWAVNINIGMVEACTSMQPPAAHASHRGLLEKLSDLLDDLGKLENSA